MSASPYARLVALVGDALVLLRRLQGTPSTAATGLTPVIPAARNQMPLPTLKMPTARGWKGDEKPIAAKGLKVNAFARGLDHPRWVEVLPGGEVLVAEASSRSRDDQPAGLYQRAMRATMQRAGASPVSANRITLLADRDGDGAAEHREPWLTDLFHPFGMALKDNTFFVGNTDGILAFEMKDTRPTGPGKPVVAFKPHGHWTRSLLLSQDRTRLYAGVGSETNIADNGMEPEEGRACIWEIEVATGKARIFASGLRNPVGMAWEPVTGALWTVVNERDGLGDETPPDYLTRVEDGGFYGWPYSYWDRIVDDRVPQDPQKVAASIQPDYALGGHTASLGLCWMPEGTLPGFPAGMAIGQHGSWNRSKLSGYAVVFVAFENGRPVGAPRDILTGFLAPDEKFSYGRPVGVSLAPGGGLLVVDDVGNAIWRVTGA